MRLAVVGSRSFTDGRFAYALLDVVARHLRVDLVVSGGAAGADSIGENWADERGIPKLILKPDWDQHGNGAGMIRNTDIVKNADVVMAFWDGHSRGTRDTIKKAVDKLRIVVDPTGNRIFRPTMML